MSSKVLSASGLLAWRGRMRAAGRTVVHCHGCFDIVHPGHIAHLQEARRLGDVLIVSVSSDANVSKGFARPLIPDDLRAASLAALECVDAVFVNSHPTAVELLSELGPDVFVKGKEYERSADPRFLAERAAVTAAGGRVAFTSGEIVYSSTALIAALTDTDPFEGEKLFRLRQRHSLTTGALAECAARFKGKRVMVVGDYIQDVYHFCDATRVASEGPMLTLRALGQQAYDGGAAVIARHLAAMGAEPVLVTSLAGDDASSAARSRLEAAGVHVLAISNRRELVVKRRFLAETTKVMKVDEGEIAALDSAAVDELGTIVDEVCKGADAAILADFGYGVLTTGAIERVLPKMRQNVPIISADISGRQGSLRRFKGVDLVTPTERELRETVGDLGAGLNALAWNHMGRTGVRNMLVTLGRQGAVAFDRQPGEAADGRLRSEHFPAFTRQALDPLGCGDAMLAAATLVLSTGGSLQAAGLVGSLAAGVAAGRLGNDAVSVDDLLGQIARIGDCSDQAYRMAS